MGASLRYLYEDRFKCFDREYKTEMSYKTHINRNSCKNIIKDKRSYHKFDNILYKKCFCNYYNPNVNLLIKISNHIKEFGTLPNYLTEEKIINNKLMQYHNIIQAYIAEYEKIELEKAKSKIKN